MIPAQLGILHPTGYPLYTLLVKAFTLLPFGSVAWRANLFSAVAAAAAVGVAVLIAIRLHVRPVIAFGAALCLAFTGTIWEEATFSEMNGLHLFLAALLVHRALVWRDERRDRDIVIGGLLGGLCVSNHGLAITVVPIVILFVLFDARREILAAPLVLVQAGGRVRHRAAAVPVSAAPGDGRAERPVRPVPVLGRVLRARERRPVPERHALPVGRQPARGAWRRCPRSIDHLVTTSNVVFVLLGVVGIALLIVARPVVRQPAAGARSRERLLLRQLPGRPVALPAADVAHPGDRSGGHGRLAGQPGRALARGTGVRRPVRGARPADRPARLELEPPRPVEQPRRRGDDGADLRRAAARRGPGDLLGHADPAQLQALHRRRPSGRQPPRAGHGGARHVRHGSTSRSTRSRRSGRCMGCSSTTNGLPKTPA